MDALLIDEIVPRICSFLVRFDSPISQLEAVWCVTNLACGSPDVLDALYRLDVAGVLVNILASIPTSDADKSKLDLRDHCLWALSNLCAAKEDIRQAAIQKGIVSIVLEDLGLKICTTGRVRPDLNPSLISLRYMAWLLCNVGKSLHYQYLDCLPSIIEALAFLMQLEDSCILVDAFRFISLYCLESSNETIVNTSIERMLEYGIFSRIMIVLHKTPYSDTKKSINHSYTGDNLKMLAKTNDLRFFAIRTLSKALILGDTRQKCGLIVSSRTLDACPLQMQLAADAEYYGAYRLNFVDREDQVNFVDDPASRNRLNGTVQGTVIAVNSGEYLTNTTPVTILRDLDATIISIFKAMRAIHMIDDQYISSLMEIPSAVVQGMSLGQVIFQSVIKILQRGLSSTMKVATSFILCQFLSADYLLKALCDNMCSTMDPRSIAVDIRNALKDALNTNDIEVLTAVLVSANKVLNYFARINIRWIDEEFIDKISFFIHYKNPKIQRAASDLQASIDRLEELQ